MCLSIYLVYQIDIFIAYCWSLWDWYELWLTAYKWACTYIRIKIRTCTKILIYNYPKSKSIYVYNFDYKYLWIGSQRLTLALLFIIIFDTLDIVFVEPPWDEQTESCFRAATCLTPALGAFIPRGWILNPYNLGSYFREGTTGLSSGMLRRSIEGNPVPKYAPSSCWWRVIFGM